MSIKELWSKVDNWWTTRDSGRADSFVAVDEDGLICDDGNVVTVEPDKKRPKPGGLEIVKKGGALDRKENVEMLSKAFDSLINELGGINEHLDRQIAQHEKLIFTKRKRLPFAGLQYRLAHYIQIVQIPEK